MYIHVPRSVNNRGPNRHFLDKGHVGENWQDARYLRKMNGIWGISNKLFWDIDGVEKLLTVKTGINGHRMFRPWINSDSTPSPHQHTGLMVSALNTEVSSLSSSSGRGHCAVFLGKTLNSHSTDKCWGVTLWWTSIPSRGNRNTTPSRFMPLKQGWALAWWATWLSNVDFT